MTTTRKSRIALVGLLGFAAFVGCTNPGLTPWKSGSLASSSEGESAESKQSKEELPPKEAARACLAAAEELQKGGHSEQAILLYEKARRNDPGLKTVAHHLAVLYDLQGDSTKSLAEFNSAVEAEPNSADVHSDLGFYYLERDNLGDAERELRKAIAIDPKHAKALTNLGMVLAGEQHFDESFLMFSKAVGPAAAHSNLGVLLAKQGRTDDARREFHEALALDSTLKQPQAFLDYLDHSRR